MTDIQLGYLADHPDFIPTLAQWLHNEWGYLYPGATLATRTERMKSLMNRERMPLAVTAFDASGPLGTASLVADDMESHPELTPWLASVFVGPEARRRGIGAMLVERIIEECRKLGFPRCYLWTGEEETFYAARGWTLAFREPFKDKLASVMFQDVCVPRAST